MNVDDILAEIEAERLWREQELRLLKNQLDNIMDEGNRNRYRNALTVMLYAYFEGFVKNSFSIYVEAINKEGLQCKDASPYLVAAALDKEFADLLDANRK